MPDPLPTTGFGSQSRPGDLSSVGGSSGFGTTILDVAPPPKSAPSSAFDVCHVGVVLRAVLFVHGVAAIAVCFVSSGPSDWLFSFATASAFALPALLLWLVVACLCKSRLANLPDAAQWAAAVLLGALSGAYAWGLLLLTGAAPGGGHWRWLAPVLSAAAMAAAIFHWLRLRARSELPAATVAKLAELQSRIRPHFLFNTLNTAIALVRLDPARAEAVLEDLSELFRVALNDSDAAVTLAEEVELAQRYLAIEQIRFGSRLSVSWELDPAAGAAKLPPLLLQPLVENAVRHGVEPSAEGGAIRVRTRLRRGHAIVSVSNSLPGLPSQPGRGMALRNVRERL
ncbi:MAG TPA: sensor histidine kinase, partial [Methylibium sp.]